MIETINEKVNMITIYDAQKGIVMPYKMQWRRREYKILKIGYHHKVRSGRELFHIFSVSNNDLAFRLRFDTDTLHWILEEISDGNPS